MAKAPPKIPSVSVIVPCYNEVRTIRALLRAIAAQTFGLGDMEVIISDGGSMDGTREAIMEMARSNPRLKLGLVDNPDRNIPAALNRALDQASGSVILRLDAHSEPANDYIERCVRTLKRTQAANVGGVWEIRPGANTWLARSIAAAVSHPLGAGDARYRAGAREGEVDTVPFGAFDRAWMHRVGRFNEALLTNEDYEYNYRIRQAGGRVWLDPSIRCGYFARPDLVALARQYWRYGYWKARMVAAYPRSLRLRQAVPAGFVALLILLGVGSLFSSAARLSLASLLTIYFAVLLLAALLLAVRGRDIGRLVGMPLAWATVHLSWGAGFLDGLPSALAARGRDGQRR